jgi:hypothetical protein
VATGRPCDDAGIEPVRGSDPYWAPTDDIEVHERGVLMRSRAYRRNQTPNRRKVLGAVVVGGVLAAAGLAGVQLASASTTPKAADVVTVDGRQFDIANCAELEINGADVICDGEKLAPQQEQGADDAALASAQALEAACDTFAADAAADAAGQDAGGQDAGGQDAGGQEAAPPAAAKAENKRLAAKWAKAMKAAEKAKGKKAGKAAGKAGDQAGENAGPGEAGAGEAGAGDAGAGDAGAAAAAAVASAQKSLLQTCLALADAKAAAGIGAGAGDDGAADPSAAPSEEPSAAPSED